ncbi:MAG: hypothetical protein ACOXZ4_02790 [Sphaerochaetaceae bacterium]|jgi:uncharacterized membrane protein
MLWLLILGIIIYLWAKPAKAPASDEPLEILRRRYAQGEIERQEFLDKQKDLRQGR